MLSGFCVPNTVHVKVCWGSRGFIMIHLSKKKTRKWFFGWKIKWNNITKCFQKFICWRLVEISACEKKLLPEILRVSKHGFCYHNALPKTSASPHLAQRSPFAGFFLERNSPFGSIPSKIWIFAALQTACLKGCLEVLSRELTYLPDKAYLKMIFLFPGGIC